MIAFVEPEGTGKELVVVNFKVLSQRPYNRLVLQGITFFKTRALCVLSYSNTNFVCVCVCVCVCVKFACMHIHVYIYIFLFV
jgi:hypothetical protein